MNILVITQMYSQPDDVGDNKPTKTVNYFVKEWAELGHNAVVMHCPSKFPLALYLFPKKIKEKFANRISTMVPSIKSRKTLHRFENKVEVYRIPMLKLIPGKPYSSRAMEKQSNKITNILNKKGFVPDLVCGHFANPSVELVNRICNFYNCKSSIVFHQDCSKTCIEKYRISENILGIKAVGARSIIEAEQIKKDLELKELPFVCCSGVPTDTVNKANKECKKHNCEDGINYLYVGSLIARKHLDSVIKAFDNVASGNDKLNIVGGGPELDYLTSVAQNSKNKDRIIFTGRIPREEVFEKMQNANVFTLISSNETYGMVYIEAMLQGCMVIASKGGGFDGIIKDGVNGFLCKAGDSEMLEKIYRKIKNMPVEERNRIGQSAIDTAIHYSEREVAEKYLENILERNER